MKRKNLNRKGEAVLGCLCILPHLDPPFAHRVEPLYGLFKKGQKAEWEVEHIEPIERLKEKLVMMLAL